MNLTILGAGAWGTALAIHAAKHHAVQLWMRSAQQCAQLNVERQNSRYLPGVCLPPGLSPTVDFSAAVAHARGGLIVIATPMAALQAMLAALPIEDECSVLWLCKGVQQGTGYLGHEVASHVRPHWRRVGLLSGPSFALEVAQSQPTALVVASLDDALCQQAIALFHGDTLRIYRSHDPVGVEVGGAVKNVLAIAAGIVDGLSLGMNARAALITRGLAEMTRLGVALGGHSATFMGLSGLGDLVLTATGHLSRNRQVGLLLAQGLALPEILQNLGHVAEGVACATAVAHRAQLHHVSMPITQAVVQVLQGTLTAPEAIEQLMARSAQAEH
jgi:glycerol-3-phosphate dehydrogenase (NAD(P)+)